MPSLGNCICVQICYFFYKNIAFGLTLFYFEAYTGFSGQSVYDDWYMLLFNVILTSLPVISLGAFEQDVSSEICLQVGFVTCYMLILLASNFHLIVSSFFFPFICSFQRCTNKDRRTCSLTGIGYLVGWPMVCTHRSLFSSSISTY